MKIGLMWSLRSFLGDLLIRVAMSVYPADVALRFIAAVAPFIEREARILESALADGKAGGAR